MSNLPPALSPWATQLDIFPREVAVELGPLVQRLAAAIGQWRSLPERGLVEPDGFSGLSRRGHYERLLTTEWLLAEEAPLEFLRRAAQGEHAFLQIERRDPQNAGYCAVLCDAGPNQMGAPRIVQLAALLVLVRRAAAVNARFEWGILQSPSLIFEDLSPATVHRFLQARGAELATPQHVAEWRTLLELRAGDKAAQEHWWLGADELKPWTHREALLLLRDPLELETRQIEASVLLPDTPARTLRLDLPEDKICARLLRDPFETATAKPTSLTGFGPSSAGGMVFSVSGSKLLVRSEAEEVVAFAIPNVPQDQVSRRRYRLDEGFVPVAAGREGKVLHIIGLNRKGQLLVRSFGGRQKDRHAIFEWADMPEGYNQGFPWKGHLGPCYRSSPATLCALLPGGHLLQLQEVGGSYTITFQDERVFAVTYSSQVLVYGARHGENEARRRRLGATGHRESWRLDGPSGICVHAVTGYAGAKHNRVGIWAASDGQAWRIYLGSDTNVLFDRLDPNTQVYGVIGTDREPVLPALVVEDPDGTLRLIGPDMGQPLPGIKGPLAECILDPGSPQMAYRTESGEIGVYSIALEKALLRILPEVSS